jgi:hypothetical protein
MTHDPDALILAIGAALLQDPGDVTSRMALADLLQEGPDEALPTGLSAHAAARLLRLPGHWLACRSRLWIEMTVVCVPRDCLVLLWLPRGSVAAGLPSVTFPWRDHPLRCRACGEELARCEELTATRSDRWRWAHPPCRRRKAAANNP